MALNENLRGNSGLHEHSGARRATPADLAFTSRADLFLRIPPFPAARVQYFGASSASGVDPSSLADRLRSLRVGGKYWAAQPKLPSDYVLARSPLALRSALDLAAGGDVVCWHSGEVQSQVQQTALAKLVEGDCDPWHMLSGASALIGESDPGTLLIASLLGVPCFGVDEPTGAVSRQASEPRDLLHHLSRIGFADPFTGEEMDALEAAELCGFWRQLIDSNRGIAGGVGFAFWKQSHVATLLWGGSAPFRFVRNADAISAGDSIAVWRSKAPSGLLAKLEEGGCSTIEVEDGFLRSRGLGADCVPPLSITVDRLGPHFDPAQASELEHLLEHGRFDAPLLKRARELRALIVEAGIGKYDCARCIVDRPAGARRHILVPGQVEDDRAVQAGGCGLTSNLELLARVRAGAPDAYILYKPHPDVVAGHRRGAIARGSCLSFADEIVGELPISSLIEMVDEVHVNSSLAGFEALLREKPVITHGVPFYAGWGLTSDRGPVPERRTAKRTLDELVAATLLLYPRYLDPCSGLPCPPEIVVARLSSPGDSPRDLLVGMRRLQGKFMRRLRSLVQ